MTTKAFITKRNAQRNKDTEAMENITAEKLGFKVEKNFSRGTLISVDRTELLADLEKEGYRVKLYPETNILDVGLVRINVEEGSSEIPSELQIPESAKDSWPHHIVFCKSPPSPSMVREIEEEGIDVVEIMSQKAIFISCKPQDIEKISHLPFVAKILPFQPAYKLDGKLLKFEGNIQDVLIDVYPPQELETVKNAVVENSGKIISVIEPPSSEKTYGKLIIEIDSKHISALARLPYVRRLEFREPKPVLDGERETQILSRQLKDGNPAPGYQLWLSKLGLSGQGVTIAICDTGIDANSKNNENGHLDIRGRQAAFLDYTNGKDVADTNGHGTHVAGICIGNAATGMREGVSQNDFLWGQGVAPNSSYVNVNFLSKKTTRGEDNYKTLIEEIVKNGAQIMNNSWGSRIPNISYNDDVKTFDGLCRDPTRSFNEDLIIVFSSGNQGPDYQTLTSPHAAKNPIIVGNSLTFNSPRYDNYRGINQSSSRGPTSDDRIKPDIVAPGTYVSSAWAKTGDALQWGRNFVPGTQNSYMFGTGTSMAAPHISGACALIIEWWRKKTNGKDPSLALVKAILINSAEDLAGGPSGRIDSSGNPILLKHIPNNNQGWGLVNMDRVLKKLPDGDHVLFSNQRNPFTASSQEHSIEITPFDENEELRIALAWTDPPGEIGSTHALVNDLDLEVTEKDTGKIYKGNVFSEGYSITGGNYDNKNNVECVYIKKPKGQYEIRIIATISANARPPFNKVPWQDYALVISNAKPIDNSSEGILLD